MKSKAFDFEQLQGSLRLATDQPSEFQLKHLYLARQRVKPYDGCWQAPWLLSDWMATEWQTTSGSRTRQKNGQWIGTSNVYWAIPLPDNSRLTDTCYATLLETCRRLSFLYRQGYANNKPPSIASWVRFNQQLLSLCQWLVLERSRYHPDIYGLNLLDQAGMERLLRSIATGDWSEALGLVERCLSGLYQTVFQEPCPAILLADPGRWPPDTCQAVIEWLEANQGYSYARPHAFEHTGLVSRVLLGKLASAPVNSLKKNQYLNAVLRQFEPKLAHPKLLIRGQQKTEYPNQNTPMLKAALCAKGSKDSVIDVSSMLRLVLMLYRHQPEYLPSPVALNLPAAVSSTVKLAAPGNHTAFVPIDTGLKYLNNALRWVVLYGDALVDYYLAIMSQLCAKVGESVALRPWKKVLDYDLPKVLCQTPLPQALKDAGFAFTKLGAPKIGRDFKRLRSQPTLHEALEIYIGAVTVVIALMKPSRDCEVANLPRLCLLRTCGGHYWLDSDLAKRTKSERRARTGGKPIPVITARAIQQVRKLNRGLSKLFGEDDMHLRFKLFYLPNPAKWGTGKEIDSSSLNSYLDKFCDYIGLPPDEHGRRWYLRIHEMRKWFLLLLFWSGRYDVLDAARWIAGHTDVDHLYAYIEREFPSSKIAQLEAECAIELLVEYDTTLVTVDGEDESLVELYQRVLCQFQVKALNMVPEREWQALVENLFEHDYHLAPYSITADDGYKRLCVAIRQGKRNIE
ncbi:hypothetical protein HRJ45_21070 [Vibrio coralliilyticus]|uniref:hypothetical protein n=1 Tax=Vibrio coralliilyticus TaxID=190893 RepID=UPI00155F9EB1|nr:hypothetical protein [Vibrio coralliilyticus]NRF27279.1 hypothetical protein [Vibrio coralliilyticus]NRF81607.1 hypothetical protein [Vibrio coralliilyticus]